MGIDCTGTPAPPITGDVVNPPMSLSQISDVTVDIPSDTQERGVVVPDTPLSCVSHESLCDRYGRLEPEPVFVNSPLMREVPEEHKDGALRQFQYWESELSNQPTEVLMDSVEATHRLLTHIASHLLVRFCKKYHVTLEQWKFIMRRCNVACTEGNVHDQAGAYNLMALDEVDLRRLYNEAPAHHASLLGIGKRGKSLASSSTKGGGIKKKKHKDKTTKAVSAVEHAVSQSFGTVEEDEL